MSGYPTDYQVHTADPVNPGDVSGVTKCFGEALGRYMAEQEGVGVVCLRIGAFQPPEHMATEAGLKVADAWVSPRDLMELVKRCIEADPLRFAIFHGVSDNRFKRLDVTDARERVGYAPVDDIVRANASMAVLAAEPSDQNSAVADGGESGLRVDAAPVASTKTSGEGSGSRD